MKTGSCPSWETLDFLPGIVGSFRYLPHPQSTLRGHLLRGQGSQPDKEGTTRGLGRVIQVPSGHSASLEGVPCKVPLKYLVHSPLLSHSLPLNWFYASPFPFPSDKLLLPYLHACYLLVHTTTLRRPRVWLCSCDSIRFKVTVFEWGVEPIFQLNS
jgi:hypothetical protein